MISLEMTGDTYDGIPAEASALTTADLQDLAIKKDPLYIPHCIAMIKGLLASVTTLEGQVETLEGQIETLEGQIGDLQDQLAAATTTEETVSGGGA